MCLYVLDFEIIFLTWKHNKNNTSEHVLILSHVNMDDVFWALQDDCFLIKSINQIFLLSDLRIIFPREFICLLIWNGEL